MHYTKGRVIADELHVILVYVLTFVESSVYKTSCSFIPYHCRLNPMCITLVGFDLMMFQHTVHLTKSCRCLEELYAGGWLWQRMDCVTHVYVYLLRSLILIYYAF